MKALTSLQEDLEKYLKREGLYEVMPEHRRRNLSIWPILLIWLVGLWGPVVYFSLRHRGVGGLAVAVLGPPALFLVVFFFLAIAFAVRQWRSGRKLTNADAGAIGGWILLAFPLLITITLGVYLKSWLIAIEYIALYTAVMVVTLLLHRQAYRVHLLVELALSVSRALWRSVALLLVLIPLLLVVVVLSVFSQELWQALGTLSLSRLAGTTLCLIIPILILILTSLSRETAAIVDQFPAKSQIIADAENTPYIKNGLERGLISQEEWSRLRRQLEWRSTAKLTEMLSPILEKRTRRWLALLLTLTSLALVFSFFIYFYIFFSIVLTPSLITTWTGIRPDTLAIPIGLLGHRWELHLSTTSVAIAKSSLVLAVFTAVISGVQAITDETTKRVFYEWLKQKTSSWLAVSSLYLCATSPNYEIWEYVVRDKKKGIANVSIVVPKGISADLVEDACGHLESQLDEYRNLVIVTAFEENPERPLYRLEMPGNRWRLLHNKVKNVRVFEPIHSALDELRDQHSIGVDLLQKGEAIPDGWFGNTPEGIALGKSVWESDTQHEWILHPYVFHSTTILSLEIRLTKRKQKSDQYRQYVRDLLGVARQTIPDAKNVLIELLFRDTLETLARLDWSRELPYVEYRDEIIGKSRIEKPSIWN